MNNFFATEEGAWGDGSVRLTTVGLIIVIAVIAVLIAVSLLIRYQKHNATAETSTASKKSITTKQLVFSAAAMALAIVTSMIKFANLPMGGSVTLFSMFFVTLIGYWYGPSIGLMTGFAYGLLQFIMEPIFYTIPQMLLDYPLAFGALGLSGFFYQKKHGLQIGYIVGVLGRFVFSTISGVVFFGSYAPEGTPALVYSLTYQASYILPEAVATLIIISIPAVANALSHVKRIARADVVTRANA